jgi:hypothetical protein
MAFPSGEFVSMFSRRLPQPPEARFVKSVAVSGNRAYSLSIGNAFKLATTYEAHNVYVGDVQTAEFIQHFEKMTNRTGHPVETPSHHDVESSTPSVGHELIQSRSLGLGAADCVGVLADKLVTTSRCQGRSITAN